MRGGPIVPIALALAACATVEPPPPAREPAPAPVAAPVVVPEEILLTGTLPGDRVPAFSTKVRRAGGAAAVEETLDLPGTRGVTVLVVMSTRCPDCAEAVGPLRRVEEAFQWRGVDFVYLYPVRAEPEEEKIAWHARQGFRAGLSLDPAAAASRLLAADKTPTALVVGRGGVIVYRGAVAETPPGRGPASHFLADALDEHLAGRTVSVPLTEPAG